MILLALFALALIGATVALLAWASVLPGVRAANRLDQITAYGGAAAAGGVEASPPSSALLQGVGEPTRLAWSRAWRARARTSCAGT